MLFIKQRSFFFFLNYANFFITNFNYFFFVKNNLLPMFIYCLFLSGENYDDYVTIQNRVMFIIYCPKEKKRRKTLANLVQISIIFFSNHNNNQLLCSIKKKWEWELKPWVLAMSINFYLLKKMKLIIIFAHLGELVMFSFLSSFVVVNSRAKYKWWMWMKISKDYFENIDFLSIYSDQKKCLGFNFFLLNCWHSKQSNRIEIIFFFKIDLFLNFHNRYFHMRSTLKNRLNAN